MNKSHTYFENLNYTMSNEDSTFEYEALNEGTKNVLCIAGSGSRVLPLFAKKPQSMTICDYSIEQLAITATRIATVKQLEYDEFLTFWGYPQTKKIFNKKRKKIFQKLIIPEHLRQVILNLFEIHHWSPLLYVGKYEQTLIKMSKFIQLVLGQKHIHKLQSFENHQDFENYLENDFPIKKWRMLIALLGNSTTLNALLYKGTLPKKNIKISHTAYYRRIFDSLFNQYYPKECFFLQMLFFGRLVDLQGAPLEANYEIFEQMKYGIKNCEIQFSHGDLFSNIEEFNQKFDFISFSDILSYFPEDIEDIYLQKLKKHLNPNALTIHRYYLHLNIGLDTTGYLNVSDRYNELISKEKTQIYFIDVYQKDIDD